MGDRFYEMGAEDGSYPATGFHTRGEMGGFWTPPIKLLDGLWFKAGDTWLSRSTLHQRLGLPADGRSAPTTASGITRTDFAPDGVRAGLVGLRFSATRPTTLAAVDAHSELMKVYPWGETTPSQTTYNLADTGAVDGKEPAVPRAGHPAGAERRARTTTPRVVGSSLTPTATDARPRPPRARRTRR